MELQRAFDAGELEGLHSVLVIHGDDTLAEKHFTGKDEHWGRPLGVVEHGPASLHDLRSVTKSVTGLVYGIALSEGLVPGLDDSLLAEFPEYADLAKDERRAGILVHHALTMQMGTEWNEDLPYTDPRNSEIAMEKADDRNRFVLGHPMIHEPGTVWRYNGGATALIGHLVAKGTGRSIDRYAREKLFAPLGIEDFEWMAGSDGVPSTASGLRLNIHDMARIGQLVLDNGAWEGRQIVPASWLEASFTPWADTGEGPRYGLFWWLAPEGTPPYWVAGFGNGGQRLWIHPRRKLIVAVFAGRYNDWEAWQLPVKIIVDFAIPATNP